LNFIDNSDQLGSLAYGAVDISGSVVFDNCILRNNGSLYGGAIFLEAHQKSQLTTASFRIMKLSTGAEEYILVELPA
jgi:hypothetical protein